MSGTADPADGLSVTDNGATAGPAAQDKRWPRGGISLTGLRIGGVSVGATAVATLAFSGLVALLWAPFGPRNGMGYETAFPFMSQTSSFLHGFQYYADPLRINTNFFYQLAFVIGEAGGVKGSYFPYQLVYALLWLGRGLLAFLIARRLIPRAPWLAYTIGALVIVHASDHALNWVGQLNQFGMIFWLMLALYLLIVSLQASTLVRAGIALGLSMLATYMCLWSYESGIFIIAVTPVLLVLSGGWRRQTVATLGVFYLVPLVYIAATAVRYSSLGGGQTYQSTVLRKDRQLSHLLSDGWFNVKASLEFWRWTTNGLPPAHAATQTALSAGAAATFVVGAILFFWRTRRQSSLMEVRTAFLVLGVGALLLVLSFPSYVLLTSARQLWRTQFLSGIGAGVFLAGLAALAIAIAHRAGRRATSVGVVAALGFGGAVSYFGAGAAYRAGAFHYGIWQRHRTAVVEILRVVPRIQPNSLVVLTNVPRTADPFGDNMWFDFAMRVAYPNEAVSGVYFYSNGTPSPSDPLRLSHSGWTSTGVGYPSLVEAPPLDRTVVVRFGADGRGKLLHRLPSFLARRAGSAVGYRPAAVIEPGPPSPIAVERYHP